MSSEDPADGVGDRSLGRDHYIITAEEKEERQSAGDDEQQQHFVARAASMDSVSARQPLSHEPLSSPSNVTYNYATLASPVSQLPDKAQQQPAVAEQSLKQDGTVTPPVAPNAASAKYLALQHQLRKHWTDCPDVYVHYSGLQYTLRVPVVEISTPSFLKVGANGLLNLAKRLDLTGTLRKHDRTLDLHALASCNGRITPGKMTLILAPPGHGKSTLLKALAGRLNRDSKLKGEILYNGVSAKELKRRGIVLPKLVTYVGQTDMHFPTLTVRETLAFAAENSCASVVPFHDDVLTQMEAERPDRLIHMIGLEEASSTIIGNDLLRGISGGQRKRVTVGELLITNARVFCLDEVSTGLDSAITFHIFNALRQYCGECNNSVVTALLQPTPETYGLFDEVILMRDGEVVFHGRREDVAVWFRDGLGCPIPQDEDEAGFIVDYLTNPQLLLENQKRKQERKRKQLQYREESRNGRKHEDAEEKAQSDSAAQDAAASVTVIAAMDDDDDGLMAKGRPTSTSVTSVTSTEEMLSRYRASNYYSELMQDAAASRKLVESDDRYSLNPARWSRFSTEQYAMPFPHSWAHHFQLAVTRQSKLFWRNKQVLAPRIFQAVLMGIVYGTLFYQLNVSDYQSKLGLMMYLTMFGAFANLSELPVAAEARAVVTKQLDSSFHPTLPYIFSVIFLGLPLFVVETLIFGSLLYWLPGFDPDAGRFFFFLLVLFCGSLGLSTFFRTISYCTPNPDVARQMDFPFIVLFVIFGGFLIPYNEIPDWLIWLFWLSPLSWGVRSLALNEYGGSRYDGLQPGTNTREGDYYLQQFDVNTNQQYKWAGIGYLLGFFLTFSLVSSYAITNVRAGGSLGTKRLPAVDAKAAKAADLQIANGAVVNSAGNPVQPAVTDSVASAVGSAATAVGSSVGAPMGAAISTTNSAAARDPLTVPPQVGAHLSVPIAVAPKQMSSRGKSSFQMTGMPFTPVTLAWRDIHYYVTVKAPKGKQAITKHLLRGISGYSKPGSLTALMGSSGAGKTTLMDVIAGRKTVGKITGDILVNGRPKDTESFNHLTGYVEQNDLHMGLHTVREALNFSAKLRLPASVPASQRDAWVEEVMVLVGLTRISHRIIGDAATPGLSPGQLKLVTIAVELVANPSVLFLDEPTSGLDAPSAYRIMKAVSRIARTGRSVLCTIHQPSAELFFMFNRLLLLRTGGEEVYFSDIGPHAAQLVEYFETSSHGKNPPQLPIGQNPANWMLDVIGAGVHSEEGGAIAALDFEAADWHAIWKESKLCAEARAETEFLCQPGNAGDDAAAIVLNQPYINQWQRYLQVQHRYFTMHWRNAPTNLSRCILMLINGILLGLIYLNINKTSFTGVISFLAVIFLGISFPASVSSASAFPSFFRQRAVYYRESTVGMYNFFTYSCAMTIVELPYIFFALIFFIVPFYFMIGFANSGTLFFKFYLVVYVQALVYSFLSQLWMALCPSQISSNIINGLFMSLFFMFGGLFIKASAMPTGWKWFYWIDPVPKTFIAASLPQFWCEGYYQPNTTCPTIQVVNTAGATETTTVYAYVSSLIDGAYSEYWPMIGWLLLTMLVIRILNLLALRFISHIKR